MLARISLSLVVNACNSKPDPTFQNLVIEVVFCNYSVVSVPVHVFGLPIN